MITARFYSLTQRIIHRAMTRAYLLSLGSREPPQASHRVLGSE